MTNMEGMSLFPTLCMFLCQPAHAMFMWYHVW